MEWSSLRRARYIIMNDPEFGMIPAAAAAAAAIVALQETQEFVPKSSQPEGDLPEAHEQSLVRLGDILQTYHETLQGAEGWYHVMGSLDAEGGVTMKYSSQPDTEYESTVAVGNGDILHGKWVNGFLKQGQLTMQRGDDTFVYDGEFEDNLKHGKGKIFRNKKLEFEGVFLYDTPLDETTLDILDTTTQDFLGTLRKLYKDESLKHINAAEINVNFIADAVNSEIEKIIKQQQKKILQQQQANRFVYIYEKIIMRIKQEFDETLLQDIKQRLEQQPRQRTPPVAIKLIDDSEDFVIHYKETEPYTSAVFSILVGVVMYIFVKQFEKRTTPEALAASIAAADAADASIAAAAIEDAVRSKRRKNTTTKQKKDIKKQKEKRMQELQSIVYEIVDQLVSEMEEGMKQEIVEETVKEIIDEEDELSYHFMCPICMNCFMHAEEWKPWCEQHRVCNECYGPLRTRRQPCWCGRPLKEQPPHAE